MVGNVNRRTRGYVTQRSILISWDIFLISSSLYSNGRFQVRFSLLKKGAKSFYTLSSLCVFNPDRVFAKDKVGLLRETSIILH